MKFPKQQQSSETAVNLCNFIKNNYLKLVTSTFVLIMFTVLKHFPWHAIKCKLSQEYKRMYGTQCQFEYTL